MKSTPTVSTKVYSQQADYTGTIKLRPFYSATEISPLSSTTTQKILSSYILIIRKTFSEMSEPPEALSSGIPNG